MPAERLVFVDESGAKTNFTRRTGWAPRGQRLLDAAPAGCWSQTTMIAALARDGMRAAFAFPGDADGPAFRVFAERVLAPTLRPGDVVVWDNLAVHRDAQALAAVHAAGATVRPLPPYSPDLNPIEQAWSKLKTGLRRAAARSHAALVRAFGRLLKTITPQECENYLRHAGYTNVF
jgi:transposase